MTFLCAPLNFGGSNASIRSCERDSLALGSGRLRGSLVRRAYPIKSRTDSGENSVSLVIGIPDEDEDMQWDITCIGDRFLVFTGDNEMSGFVWERV